MESGEHPFFEEFEQTVFRTSVPYHQCIPADNNCLPPSSGSEVWSWKFEYNENAGMLVTVHSSSEFWFPKEQIPLVKIASEMLYTKTRIILLPDDLQQKQEALLQSYNKLEESNALISNLLSQQEKTIEDRTEALTRLNARLVELIQFNSHNIREPLTRIMGLMSLYELMSQENFFTEYWPLLETSVNDMDRTIRQVIKKTEKIEKA